MATTATLPIRIIASTTPTMAPAGIGPVHVKFNENITPLTSMNTQSGYRNIASSQYIPGVRSSLFITLSNVTRTDMT